MPVASALICVVFVISLVAGVTPHFQGPPTVRNGPAVSATQLWASYAKDERAANAKYLAKDLRVSGTVKSVRQHEDAMVVWFEVGARAPGGVQAQLSKEKAVTIKPQQVVELVCRCDGKFAMVRLANCEIPASPVKGER